jgi:hypothetical protein
MLCRGRFLGALIAATVALSVATPVQAKDTVELGQDGQGASPAGPRLNPFECYGRYESATGNRTVSQIKIELKKKFDQLSDEEPRTVQAMKACVIARLKARLGHSDARKWFKKSIELDPEEPGYELFMGMYYSLQRGARAPVVEEAEVHLHRAISKLKALEEKGQFKSYHQIVRDFTEKRLLVLYQQDGQQLLPFKGPRPKGNLLDFPAVSAFGEVLASGDTRDFWYNNEMRVFSGEKQFAESGIRANRELTERETWDIARTPLRLNTTGGVRLRQNKLGTFDVGYTVEQADTAQIISFYQPTLEFADTRVDQLRVGYQRVFPLYPLFDLRVAGDYLYTERLGILEFEPDTKEKFHGFNLRPSLSRFLGPNKITLDGVLAYLDIQDLPGGIRDQGLRNKLIRGAKLTYSHYAPLQGVSLEGGRLLPARHLSRGLSFYGGILEDYETYGNRQVRKRDVYGGIDYGAPRHVAVNIQATHLKGSTVFVDQNEPSLPIYTDSSQNFRGLRTSAALTGIVIDQEARPLMSRSFLEVDMLNVVVPLQWDMSLEGTDSFENFRGGIAIWAKLFGPQTLGTPLLFSTGYDTQYFYNIDKIAHLWRAGLRLGWGDFL